VFLLPLLIAVAFLTLLERKALASMQRRLGPTSVGPIGLLQPIADAAKLIFKETVIPFSANPVLFIIAPLSFLLISLSIWAVIPLVPFGAVADIDLGLLYVFAMSSLNVYSVIIARLVQ